MCPPQRGGIVVCLADLFTGRPNDYVIGDALTLFTVEDAKDVILLREVIVDAGIEPVQR